MPVRDAWLVGTGLAVLLSGVLVYLGCRAQLPWLLALWPWPAVHSSCPQALSGWWPSAAHAFGFTCLLGAALGGGARALFASGLVWSVANLTWEAFCLFQGLDAHGVPLAPALAQQPLQCTADLGDALAAVIAAPVPGLMVLLASGLLRRAPQSTPGDM